MSIQGGLFAGVAAITAQATAFGIIADNIANTNTVGYKDTEARFETLVTRPPSATGFTPGGVQTRPLSDAQKQGLLKTTASGTDLAIDGNGFFVVNDAAVPTSNDQFLLTRAGNFITDEDGRLQNSAGFYLQGWTTTTAGVIENATTQDLLSSLETVDLSKFDIIANPTTSVTLGANLPAAKATGGTETTNITIFDSQGFDYLLTFNWTARASANSWQYTITLTKDPGTTGATTNTVLAATIFSFNTNGTLRSVASNGVSGTANVAATRTIAITPAIFGRSVSASSITIDFGTFSTATGFSQFNADYGATTLNQDGSESSSLTNASITKEGFVNAQYASGESRTIYKIPVATVPAPTQLEAQSGNAYTVTSNSGEIIVSEATKAGSGRVIASALENSTVDIASEFTNLILTQRAYSAATRIITTGDELLDEIIRVKR